MVGRLVVGLIWLTFVQSESSNNLPMDESPMSGDKMPMTMEDSSIVGSMTSKTKRYLSHHHSSPCPPFYPHIGMHMPMYDMRPYGPPAYPKTDIRPQMWQPPHEGLQYVHQPTYSSYVPKQTIQYVKQDIKAPIYHNPIPSPPIHHVQVVKQPPPPPPPPSYHQQWQPPMFHQPKVTYEKQQPIFAYAPAYHKPMPMIWPATQIKKYEYPMINPITYNHQPMIVAKPDSPKCEPCPPNHQIQPIHQPIVSYVKVAQPPVHQVQHSPPSVYLPAPVHEPSVQPCVK